MTRPAPPPGPVLAAFGLPGRSPRLLAGGQGRAWAAGELVLKPVDDALEAAWSADVLSRVREDGFRIERPVRSSTGKWIAAGWSAWTHLPGEHDTAGRWTEVLHVGQRLGAALRHVPRPALLDARTNAWAEADRVAWGEQPVTVVHDALRPLAGRLAARLRPVQSPSQVIHGDLTGNVLFAPGLPPAVIDFTPYWRPPQFCLAVVVVDAVLWHGAPARLLEAVPGTDERTSLLARAALRRLITSDRLAAEQEPSTRDEYLRAAASDHDRVLGLLGPRVS